MRINVKLTRLKSNHNNLRTDTVEGYCTRLPVMNEPFTMYSEPLTTGSIRQILTTRVLEMETLGNSINFKTRNSVYNIKWSKDE